MQATNDEDEDSDDDEPLPELADNSDEEKTLEELRTGRMRAEGKLCCLVTESKRTMTLLLWWQGMRPSGQRSMRPNRQAGLLYTRISLLKARAKKEGWEVVEH